MLIIMFDDGCKITITKSENLKKVFVENFRKYGQLKFFRHLLMISCCILMGKYKGFVLALISIVFIYVS